MPEQIPRQPNENEALTLRRHILAAHKSGREMNNEELTQLAELVEQGDPTLVNDKDFMKAFLRLHNGEYLRFASNSLRDDEDVVFSACSKGTDGLGGDPYAIQYASDRIKKDVPFLKRLIADIRPENRSGFISRLDENVRREFRG
ncbi:MAG: DUF4116 domain-containing protein [Patescibacteria group bacterium]|nr:DUF4116 domain-containing protein [Patescibacteria group bacterium]